MHKKQPRKQGLRNNAVTRIYAYKHISVPVECFSIGTVTLCRRLTSMITLRLLLGFECMQPYLALTSRMIIFQCF